MAEKRGGGALHQEGLPPPHEVFEIAHNAFLSLDADGRILYGNPQAHRIFGFQPGQLVGVDFTASLVLESDRELVHEAVRSLTAGGSDRQLTWNLDLRASRSHG